MSAPVLVFGDDGSPSADVAWLWVNNQGWPRWSLRVITGESAPPPASAWGVPPHAEEWTPPWGRRFFDADELASLEYLHIDADPRLALDGEIADLVVVGRRGVRSFWDVSITEWLVQFPSHPLLIARSAAVVRRVTCCVDGSPHADAAVAAATRMPRFATADVTLLAIDDGTVDTDAALARASEAVAAVGCTPRSVTASGRAPQRVLDHLAEDAPDLLVLGTRGWSTWDRLRVGSTAARVVHHTAGNCLLASAGS